MDVHPVKANQCKRTVPLPTPIKVKKLAFYLEGCHKTRYNELTLGNICEKSNSKMKREM